MQSHERGKNACINETRLQRGHQVHSLRAPNKFHFHLQLHLKHHSQLHLELQLAKADALETPLAKSRKRRSVKLCKLPLVLLEDNNPL